MTQTSDGSVPLRARKVGGGTPLMSDRHLRSETGVLKDVLLGVHRRSSADLEDVGRDHATHDDSQAASQQMPLREAG